MLDLLRLTIQNNSKLFEVIKMDLIFILYVMNAARETQKTIFQLQNMALNSYLISI